MIIGYVIGEINTPGYLKGKRGREFNFYLWKGGACSHKLMAYPLQDIKHPCGQ